MAHSQSNATQSDTPTAFRGNKSVLKMQEKVETVISAVAAELAGYVRTSDTNPLLNTLLPVPDAILESIFATVKGTGHYLETEERWKDFPTMKGARESLFYKPFEMAAEGIRAAVPAWMKNDFEGKWMDRHATTPESSEESAKARPDCLFVSRPVAVERLEKQVRELEQKVKQLPEKPPLGVPNIAKENLDGQKSIWWRQIHIPVEIKKANTNQLFDEGMRQSCCYLRLVLREQLDRRFGIALLLCKDELTVLFNDRSGLFYTKDSINIHAEPLKFIQVIAAFSILPPCRIGWDPGMKVYDPQSGDTLVSYLVGDEPRFFKPSLDGTHWEIDIPSQVKGGREKVITIAALSISRSEVLCGRATLVWEVVRKATPFNTNEIFVLKRYWRPYQQVKDGEELPSSYMPEGDRYRRVPLWGDRIYSDEDMQTAEERDYSTLEHIRRGLKMDPSTSETRSRKRVRPDGEHMEYVSVTMNPDVHPFLYVDAKALVSRVHTQVIHTYTGWPLRHFKDLNELLRVVRNIVEEHKHLYYNGLVLHRDISIENVIIMPRGDETEGRLIDLDHAKVADSSTARIRSHATPKDIERLNRYLLEGGFSADEEVIKHFLTYFPFGDHLSEIGTFVTYFDELVAYRKEYFGLKITQKITLADLGWNYEVKDSPDFSTHIARDGYQTGTLPFMSIEVLNMGPVQSPPKDFKKWCHDAVHDLESLFWVLAFICLVREGPGLNMLRRELLNSGPGSRALETILRDYFDSPDRNAIHWNKRYLFTFPTNMDSNILANFHDYFEPLKRMMGQWWQTVVLAYKFRRFEYHTIHDQILHILDQAIESLQNHQLTNDEREKTEKEEKRRQDLRNERVKWFEERTTRALLKISGDKEVVSVLEFSPQRPIGVSAPNHTQLHSDLGSPSPNRKKQKLDDIPNLGV